MKLKIRMYDFFCLIAIIIFSIVFLYIGNKIAVEGLPDLYDSDSSIMIEAKITKILTRSDKEITFEAAANDGEGKKTVTVVQNMNAGTKAVAVGDKVIVSDNADGGWVFVDFVKINKIILFACLFIISLFIFGRVKGLKTLFSLGFTCISIFAIFIPAFLSGKNIYLASLIVCIFSIVVTLYIVNGVNKKTSAAVIGCFGGVIVAGILTFIMNKTLDIRGFVNEDNNFLINLPTGGSYEFKDVVFAGIIMGAVGAATDVAMSIASALWELKCKASEMSFKEYFKSGINIGQDIVCTMTNTLVLAYIGNALSIVLILMFYVESFFEFINTDSVIIQLFQSIAGSFGILATMPITALICAAIYSKNEVRGRLNETQ